MGSAPESGVDHAFIFTASTPAKGAMKFLGVGLDDSGNLTGILRSQFHEAGFFGSADTRKMNSLLKERVDQVRTTR